MAIRVILAMILGAAVLFAWGFLFWAVWLGLNEAIWFYHPWKYELYQAGYVLVGGLLMGLVTAAIIKAKPAGREPGVN